MKNLIYLKYLGKNLFLHHLGREKILQRFTSTLGGAPKHLYFKLFLGLTKIIVRCIKNFVKILKSFLKDFLMSQPLSKNASNQ